MNPYDYVNSINSKSGKLDITNQYIPYIINKTFSYFPDTFIHAFYMNECKEMPIDAQYNYLYSTIRKGKRWTKWSKPEVDENILAIQEYYCYNKDRAKEVLKLLTNEQINVIKSKIRKGGVSK